MMAPALNTHRRPFNTRGRGRGRGRPRLYGRGGSMMGPRAPFGSSTHLPSTNGAEQTPSRRSRGNAFTNGERRATGFTFIRDITAIMGDPTAPGYKPREERSYLDFHPNLDIGLSLRVMGAEEVDGDAYKLPTLQASANNPEAQDTSVASRQEVAQAVLPIRTTEDPEPPLTPGLQNTSPLAFEADDIVVSDLVPPPVTPASRPSRVSTASSRRGGPGRPPKAPKPAAKPQTEILNLPKPSYRLRPNPSFSLPHAGANSVSQTSGGQQTCGAVDGVLGVIAAMQQQRTTKTMANIGYQESDYWSRPKHLVRDIGGFYADDLSTSAVIIQGEKKEGTITTGPSSLAAPGEGPVTGPGFGAEGERVEYDMDEQDDKWLTEYNSHRRHLEVEPISREMFEITMTKIEKEWCALEKQIPKKPPGPKTPHAGHYHRNGNDVEEEGAEDSKCAICDDGECENSNAIVFCDGCDLAVHQDCYGVPYIPEGQWLCRKCLNNPKQVVNCILCPNIDGAFKQTVSNSWAHLLCAIWIPEVVISNQVYMEPIDGIESIPKQRWKLTCYICRQRMGACIQCSNKNCFVAFHVTCARRARLFLKMKSSGGGLEFSHLKGFCDRHVPADWRRENDVENAIIDAQEFYASALSDSMWRDSQLHAPGNISESYPYDFHDQLSVNYLGHAESASIVLTSGPLQGSPSAPTTSARRRKSQLAQSKGIWKLPSGAPVIPQVVFNVVCDSIARFGVRKRKEYVAEVCKYWTLKREARRGAALIKRLQLPEASSELTRRNWKALRQGRKKLQRRLEFAAKLRIDVEKLRMLSDDVKRREKEKWRIAEMMRDYVENVYFPEVPLMQPIFEKAQLLDKGDHFKIGFNILGSRLHDRIYATTDAFYTDLTTMLQSPPLKPEFAFTFPPELGIASPNQKIFGIQLSPVVSDTINDNQAQRTANRILKAIAPLVEDAKKKENELRVNPFAAAAKEFEDRLEREREKARTASRTPISLLDSNFVGDNMDVDINVKDEAPSEYTAAMDVDPAVDIDEDLDADGEYEVDDTSLQHHTSDNKAADFTQSHIEVQSPNAINGTSNPSTTAVTLVHSEDKTVSPFTEKQTLGVTEPSPGGSIGTSQSPDPTAATPLSFPMLSSAQWSDKHPPWYLQEFDPRGLTLHEERWLGRDIARESSPLSELNEDEMLGLVGEVGEEASALAALPISSATYFHGYAVGDGTVEDNMGNPTNPELLSAAESSTRGRKNLVIRGRSRRGRWKIKGRGRPPGARGGKGTTDIETNGNADFQGGEVHGDKTGTHEWETEGFERYLWTTQEYGSIRLLTGDRPPPPPEFDCSQQTTGSAEDDMDIDPPYLPPHSRQAHREPPQTPRTSSLSPLTSVINEFESSPLSNPPTNLSQRDQREQPSPQKRGTNEGSSSAFGGDERNTEGFQEYALDDQDDLSPNTPQRRSRKNMIFARQSNGRFGSTKPGTVSSQSLVRRKKKKWI